MTNEEIKTTAAALAKLSTWELRIKNQQANAAKDFQLARLVRQTLDSRR
jgi:hypothetical protein